MFKIYSKILIKWTILEPLKRGKTKNSWAERFKKEDHEPPGQKRMNNATTKKMVLNFWNRIVTKDAIDRRYTSVHRTGILIILFLFKLLLGFHFRFLNIINTLFAMKIQLQYIFIYIILYVSARVLEILQIRILNWNSYFFVNLIFNSHNESSRYICFN